MYTIAWVFLAVFLSYTSVVGLFWKVIGLGVLVLGMPSLGDLLLPYEQYRTNAEKDRRNAEGQ